MAFGPGHLSASSLPGQPGNSVIAGHRDTHFNFLQYVEVGESLVIELNKCGFATASGSACSSTSTEPSATLLAMGVQPDIARGAVRLSFGASNTLQQAEEFLIVVAEVVKRLRRLTAVAV